MWKYEETRNFVFYPWFQYFIEGNFCDIDKSFINLYLDKVVIHINENFYTSLEKNEEKNKKLMIINSFN